MRMIEDLFYGNICPCEKSLTRGSEYSHLLDLAVKNEENLSALLSPQQKEVFEFLIKQKKVSEAVTEELKEQKQWEWVQILSNIQQQAKEIVLDELIYK